MCVCSSAKSYLHANIRVAHPPIYRHYGQLVSAVPRHGVENRLRLEAHCFHGRTSNVPTLCVLGDTD